MALGWFVLVGLVAGWLAGQLVKGGGLGFVGDIAVGVIGALLGDALFKALGVSVPGGLMGNIMVATVGAVLLLLLLRVIQRV